MTSSHSPNSAVEQKRAEPLDSARLATRKAFRVMTLCDLHGRLIACDDPPPERGAPDQKRRKRRPSRRRWRWRPRRRRAERGSTFRKATCGPHPDGECDQFLGKMAVKFIHQQKEPERRELFCLPTRPAASTIRGFVRIEQWSGIRRRKQPKFLARSKITDDWSL